RRLGLVLNPATMCIIPSLAMRQAEPLPCVPISVYAQPHERASGRGRSRGVAQSGSAPALGAGGRQFESGHPDHLPEGLWRVIEGESLVVARIYRPARSAMQSGKGKIDNWILELAPDVRRSADP